MNVAIYNLMFCYSSGGWPRPWASSQWSKMISHRGWRHLCLPYCSATAMFRELLLWCTVLCFHSFQCKCITSLHDVCSITYLVLLCCRCCVIFTPTAVLLLHIMKVFYLRIQSNSTEASILYLISLLMTLWSNVGILSSANSKGCTRDMKKGGTWPWSFQLHFSYTMTIMLHCHTVQIMIILR